MKSEIEKAVEEALATQAILELQARDKFLATVPRNIREARRVIKALRDVLVSARSMIDHQRTLLEKRGYVDMQFLASSTISQIDDALQLEKRS